MCHGGAPDRSFATMEQAHAGIVRDPSAPGQSGCLACHAEDDPESACSMCHEAEADANRFSLHSRQWGYVTAIEDRCNCTFDGEGNPGYQARCAGCHTTCGQCHVSRPNSVGGGFPKFGGVAYAGHRFSRTPDMNEQCTACHGSRVGVDYKGELAGNLPDVHRDRGYKCELCHKADEIHGDPSHTESNHYDHRYEVANMPRCEDCHGDEAGWDNAYHAAHVNGFAGDANLQCQVCHSQPYKNCTNCHNLQTAAGESYDIEPSVVQLKIARNPSPYRTEYDFVVVRHTPIDPETFANWNLSLPGYLSKSTWQYSSPHNVRRWTEQTTVPEGASCSVTCHQSPDGPEGFLLRESDLYDGQGARLVDYDANIGIVIREDFPGKK